jgi:Protein of unknown function (DUF3365)
MTGAQRTRRSAARCGAGVCVVYGDAGSACRGDRVSGCRRGRGTGVHPALRARALLRAGRVAPAAAGATPRELSPRGGPCMLRPQRTGNGVGPTYRSFVMSLSLARLAAAVSVGATLAAAVPGIAADEAPEVAAMRAAVKEFEQTLGGALKKELAEHGPESAIAVCRDLAPRVSSELSRRYGWRIARVSLRVRNPLVGMPDAHEQAVLRDFERRVEAGEAPPTLESVATVDEPAGRYVRYLRGIGVQPLCATCHGTPEAIPDGVKAALDAAYPHDAARGYAVGQLRGAFSVKGPARP